MGDVREALDEAIAAATHLTPVDAGAVAAACALADKIDAWDTIVDWALDDVAGMDSSKRPAVPANDNTSLPTFLHYCESLGLTPAGRSKLETPKEASGGGKLGSLQDQARKRRERSAASTG
jgi:hypothetical protein